MRQRVYIDPRLEKRLDVMRRSHKKAALAAAKTVEIIARLQSGEALPDLAGLLTKHGEQRIKGVMKYDLGSGYRLVTLKQGQRMFLLYVGTHDDCHRWIENNRDLTADRIRDRIKGRCAKPAVETGNACPHTENEPPCPATGEEMYDPLTHVSEEDLRLVFRGLVDGAAG